MAPSLYYPGSWIGDLYDCNLRCSDIAAILRVALKKIVTKPNRFSVRCNYYSIKITVKGPDLLCDDWSETEKGRSLKGAVEKEANRHNYNERDPGDGMCCKFYLDVEICNLYAKEEIEKEAARLQKTFLIEDERSCRETAWNLDKQSPLTRMALDFLVDQFKPPKMPEPPTNEKVADEMPVWLDKVAGWFRPLQYETGPKYYRVVDGDRTMCFVDRQDGTIHKATHKSLAPNSTRGTIFDGHEVFDKRGLIDKATYLFLLRRGFDWSDPVLHEYYQRHHCQPDGVSS